MKDNRNWIDELIAQLSKAMNDTSRPETWQAYLQNAIDQVDEIYPFSGTTLLKNFLARLKFELEEF